MDTDHRAIAEYRCNHCNRSFDAEWKRDVTCSKCDNWATLVAVSLGKFSEELLAKAADKV